MLKETGNTIHAFQPILGDKPRVLILGTMPSVKSLEKSEYYGHPRNQFWPIMFHLAEQPIEGRTYAEKVALAKRRGIAVWDVLQSCVRPGSLDADIRNEMPSDLETLLRSNPSIRCIAFNGTKAWGVFRRYFPELAGSSKYMLIRMPSTSPAYTLSFEEKLKAWRVIEDCLKGQEA